MVKIDIITAAGRAYHTCWKERRYLMKLAAVPFLLKLVCFTVGSAVTNDDQPLRYMLVMLPALLAEGWMLAHFVRLLVLEQRWPFRPTGDMGADMDVLRVRARGVLSGMIIFVLVNLALGFLLFIANEYMVPYLPEPGTPRDQAAEIPPYVGMLSLLMMGLLFWGFRLMWLHIPYALNIRADVFLTSMRGLGVALQLIALWILCFVPFFLALQMVGGLLDPKGAGPLFGPDISGFLRMIMVVLTDTVKSLVATAGITFAWMQIYRTDQKA